MLGTSALRASLVAIAATLFTACGGSSAPPAASPATLDDQLALGAKAYGEHCANCHGASGEGSGAPAVVGKDALPLDPPAAAKYRKEQFHTAENVAKFVVSSMPPGKGGSLTADEYWAILAFDLKANGVDLGGKKVGPENAASYVLHP
jgi:mono/diheme cytochrome c family protein